MKKSSRERIVMTTLLLMVILFTTIVSSSAVATTPERDNPIKTESDDGFCSQVDPGDTCEFGIVVLEEINRIAGKYYIDTGGDNKIRGDDATGPGVAIFHATNNPSSPTEPVTVAVNEGNETAFIILGAANGADQVCIGNIGGGLCIVD